MICHSDTSLVTSCVSFNKLYPDFSCVCILLFHDIYVIMDLLISQFKCIGSTLFYTVLYPFTFLLQ